MSDKEDWKPQAYQALIAYAKMHPYFTIEQVRASAGDIPQPKELRAWGSIIRYAQKIGLVERVGWVRAQTRHVHGRAVTQWKSLLC